jgi:hypothetical protein
MPTDQELSIQTVKKYNILDADIDKLFDDIAMLATESCDKPFAMVSFIDADKLWVSSQVGLFPREMDQKNYFCEQTVKQNGL